MVYLDYAAATPVDDAVLAAATPYFNEQFYNPSARYLPAKQVKQAMEAARSSVGAWLGCRGEEVFFTAGGTEANNLAIAGIMQQYPGANCVISTIEHDSVHEPAQAYDVRYASVDEQGIIDLKRLREVIDDKTVLVSIGYVNSEIGTIQPLKEVAKIIESIRKERQTQQNDLPLYFHTDACQAANYLDLHVHTLGVDMMTLNGGKIYGFKQSGCLYVHRKAQLVPLITGGGQERGLRSGTENAAFAIGFAAALDNAQSRRVDEAKRVAELRDQLIDGIQEQFPRAEVNGSTKHRVANNVHITFPDTHNEIVQLKLEQAGVLAATGSACSAAKAKDLSRVLKSIGKTDAQAQASLRFTLGRATTKKDIESALSALRQTIS